MRSCLIGPRMFRAGYGSVTAASGSRRTSAAMLSQGCKTPQPIPDRPLRPRSPCVQNQREQIRQQPALTSSGEQNRFLISQRVRLEATTRIELV
jgi:hypothetical protein